MKNFFPISRGDLCFMFLLLMLSVVAFLPWTRNTEWAGMSMLGWMMALLMVFSPTIALAKILAERGSTTVPHGEAEE